MPGASHCSGFSCGAQAVCAQAQSLWLEGFVACSVWNLPGPGIELESLALAGRFLTTGPLGKSEVEFKCESDGVTTLLRLCRDTKVTRPACFVWHTDRCVALVSGSSPPCLCSTCVAVLQFVSSVLLLSVQDWAPCPLYLQTRAHS